MNPLRTLVMTLALACSCTPAHAQMARPMPILPDSLVWSDVPNIPDLQVAWVIGSESAPGAYLLRVKLAKGGKIPVHTHPDERNSTVLMGTLHVGFGKTADESNMLAIPKNGVYVAPANIPHYLWARDGDVIYQESGQGPTGTRPVQ